MIRYLVAASICSSLLASAAMAQTEAETSAAGPAGQPPQTRTVLLAATDWTWVRRPTGMDVLEVFPPRAVRARKFSGKVVMTCAVMKTGDLENCSILQEIPENSGFGAASLKLAKKFRLATKTNDGRPTEGGRVAIPIVFQWSQ